MTKLVFDTSTGKLTGFGKSWTATSGTSSIHPLANKSYTAPAHALMTGTEKTVAGVPSSTPYDKDSSTDDNGFSWFLWIGRGILGSTRTAGRRHATGMAVWHRAAGERARRLVHLQVAAPTR
ncbi:MAG: hypothetical protein H6843_07800 [Rhodospirillaceae bacterium]|nr:hypothetical protein [Rhodospirillaceae bacterium]